MQYLNRFAILRPIRHIPTDSPNPGAESAGVDQPGATPRVMEPFVARPEGAQECPSAHSGRKTTRVRDTRGVAPGWLPSRRWRDKTVEISGRGESATQVAGKPGAPSFRGTPLAEESLLLLASKPRGIPHFVRNDEQSYFCATHLDATEEVRGRMRQQRKQYYPNT